MIRVARKSSESRDIRRDDRDLIPPADPAPDRLARAAIDPRRARRAAPDWLYWR
jgi:hypothetical protein